MSHGRAKGLGTPRHGLAALVVATVAGCHAGSHGDARPLEPQVIVLEADPSLGRHERPLVEFWHARHTKALGQESCGSCHVVDDGVVSHEIAATKNADDLDAVMRGYHGLCIGCHESPPAEARGTGPVTCGECHVRQGEGTSTREPLRLDLNLHGRHVLAEDGRCDGCHHAYDAASKRLVYRAGQESACRDCHGAEETDDARSLRRAAHESCITCHREHLSEGRDSGPITCTGCHDSTARAGFEQLAEVPRLDRSQPDVTWIHTEGAASKLVAFNHGLHETVTERCSSCHHETLRPCGECHTAAGSEAGGGVTLEAAFHLHTSERSCVGCHDRVAMADSNCAGCHVLLGRPPSSRSCGICHSGPEPAKAAEVSPEAALALGEPPELPAASKLFPERVEIGVLAKRYGKAWVPHRDVAAMYDVIVRSSKLALRFHGGTTVPCTGCHHHTPEGERPPPCSACHTEDAHPTEDRPGLRAAYHRQCIGCHQRAGLGTGCVDCHPEATDRGQR